MRILDNRQIDFLAKRKLAMAFSIALIVISLLSFLVRGLSLGIDFTGGTLVEVGYPQAVELAKVRTVLAGAGFSGASV